MSNTIETNKVKSDVFNMDCVEYMRTLPNNFFDIAICDPPYGDADSGNFYLGGAVWGTLRPLQAATNYPPHTHTQSATTSRLESTHKAERGRQSTSTRQPRLRMQIQPIFGWGKLTASYNVLTGMLLRNKSSLMNFFVLVKTKLYGVGIIFAFHLQDAFSYGENYLFRKNSLWQCASMRGLHSMVMQNYLSQFHNVESIAENSIQRKNR